MHVGLDFDNTIVSYDALFHRIAREGGLVPGDTPVSKVSVRDHLRRTGREDIWTGMQGIAYGPRMSEAQAFDGVREFLAWARGEGIRLSIVSHKTRHPFVGERHDLHAAARAWIERFLSDADGPLVPAQSVYFELTKDAKLARIDATGCDVYVDDLPEILLAPDFPARALRILFDPDGHHPDTGLDRVTDWNAVRQRVDSLWRRQR